MNRNKRAYTSEGWYTYATPATPDKMGEADYRRLQNDIAKYDRECRIAAVVAYAKSIILQIPRDNRTELDITDAVGVAALKLREDNEYILDTAERRLQYLLD